MKNSSAGFRKGETSGSCEMGGDWIIAFTRGIIKADVRVKRASGRGQRNPRQGRSLKTAVQPEWRRRDSSNSKVPLEILIIWLRSHTVYKRPVNLPWIFVHSEVAYWGLLFDIVVTFLWQWCVRSILSIQCGHAVPSNLVSQDSVKCPRARAGRYIEYVQCIVIFFETIWNEAIPFISIQ